MTIKFHSLIKHHFITPSLPKIIITVGGKKYKSGEETKCLGSKFNPKSCDVMENFVFAIAYQN
jgi:hypothetical protein